MVTFFVGFSILPDELREFEHDCRLAEQVGRTASGGRTRQVVSTPGPENVEFLYTAMLAEGDDIQAHLDSERFRTLMGAIKVLGEVNQAEAITAREVRPINQRNGRVSQCN